MSDLLTTAPDCPECGAQPSEDIGCKNIGACLYWFDEEGGQWLKSPPLWDALTIDHKMQKVENKRLQTESEAMASSLEAQARTLAEQNEDTLKLMERAKTVEGAEAFAADLETRLEHREVELDDLRRELKQKFDKITEQSNELVEQSTRYDELVKLTKAATSTGVDLANALDSYAVNVARRTSREDAAMYVFPTALIQVAQLLRNRSTETGGGIADALDYLARGC